MTFEILISTMHKNRIKILAMLTEMNIHCNCVVVNQCDEETKIIEQIDSQKISMIFTKERGLSRSRNMALRNATADIVLIADDDLYYYDSFDKTILEYYESHPYVDLAMFAIDSYSHKCKETETKSKFLELGTYISIQTSLNRNVVLNKGISFDEFFGTGSKVFDSGEENIFLADCYKKGLKIYYCPKKILKHEKSDSTWFKGFNDPKYISDRGAIYYRISKALSLFYMLRFSIVKRNLIKPISSFKAFCLMLDGKRQYKAILAKQKAGRK